MTILKRMAKDLGVRTEFIERIVKTAPHSYRAYTIPKRDGGTRQIHHPSARLKVLQRWAARTIFARLPVHASVYSYREGRGIRAHANAHKKHNYLLRIDLREFFTSISYRDIQLLLSRHREHFQPKLSEKDIALLCRISCREHSIRGLAKTYTLTIGAPSSPAISNAILYALDVQLYRLCTERGVVYTRYADDMYFSTSAPNVLRPLRDEVQGIIESSKSPVLRVNPKKTVITSRKRHRTVTGVVLTSDKKLSLGRGRKRFLKSLLYRYKRGGLASEEVSKLRGLLSFAFDIEPSFEATLRSKYGARILSDLRTGHVAEDFGEQ